MLGILKTLGKAFAVVCVFFLISGAYFLLKPTEEDKYLDQQMKRYPFGFHCTDENNEEIVIQFDMKSLIHLSTDKEVHKYTMKNALYKNNKKKPFGCELAIADNGLQKKLIVYVVDDVITDFSEIRYEQSDDKDLLHCRVNFVNNIL